MTLYASLINKTVKVPLTQGQFDALVSLLFNWRIVAFRNSNGLRYLNASNYNMAAKCFFDPIDGVVRINGTPSKGLQNRRNAEYRNFWCK